MIYWDTSCVLKLYTAESDSAAWQETALAVGEELAASALLEAELAFALEQKESRGELKPGGAQMILRIFRSDCRDGRFILYPVGSDVMKTAADFAMRCYRAREPIAIRTLDGLHLATARLLKCRALATADRRMRAAAAFLNLPLISVSDGI